MGAIQRRRSVSDNSLLQTKLDKIAELCRCYEYYYDAYFSDNASFPECAPSAKTVAKHLQTLCREVLSET